ncbi:Oidioi.mRNA.OKI2018_I69.chr2.g8284.t1.cds [Oikopleura dioica]|uniref:Oidioi.mRNA.OKI2018_I69.chr2.g8284.t1.cds n=1 Tax=Oikopleura dioica TaxID=34765 RepID=A0ABN7TDE1_OIKDI|nr:Oidioi.mRNA.OKI2018_I69.chr2.g8284.t1.cds [Oikopleura dioica]
MEALVKALSDCTPSFITIPRHKKGNACGYAFLEFNSIKLAQKVHSDFNSKRAMSTAFLLTSNRRKLFQNKMREKQSSILEEDIPIPPPCLRFLPEDERLRRKPRTPLVEVQSNNLQRDDAKNTAELPKTQTEKQMSIDENYVDIQLTDQPEIPTDRVSRKRRRSPSSQDLIDGLECHPVKELKIDPDSIEVQAEPAEEHELIIQESKETQDAVEPSEPTRPISLFLRARRNSFPPLFGCYAHHGLTYWAPELYAFEQGTVSSNPPAISNGLHQDVLIPPQNGGSATKLSQPERELISTGTQTESSSINERVEHLLKYGRSQAEQLKSRKRKIPSTISVVPAKKRRRKSRIRRRNKGVSKPINTRNRRSMSNLIIPSWGGNRFKAYLGSEWQKMKREYKQMQKSNMGRLKQRLKDDTFRFMGAALRKHIKHDEVCKGLSDDEDEDDQSATENEMDFNSTYPVLRVHDPRGARRKGDAPTYRPGVIVKITSDGALSTHERIRARFDEYGNVAYVDVKPGSNVGYVRFSNQSGAQKAIELEGMFKLELLTGREEDNYWEDLLQKRETKRSSKRKKTRGVDRLARRAAKQKKKERKLHILFDVDMEDENDF